MIPGDKTTLLAHHSWLFSVIIVELMHKNQGYLQSFCSIMQESPHYLHLKHKGLFQPSSWPFCSSISTVDTADEFIYLNCALPSSAIIADKYLSFQNKLNAQFAATSCLEQWKDPVLTRNLFSKSLGWFQLFFMILPRAAVSNSETNSSQAEEDSSQFLLPAQEPGNLLTGLCKKHELSISPSIGTLLIFYSCLRLLA